MELEIENQIIEEYDTKKGVYYLQQDRVDELNSRITERQFPDNSLEPYFDPRPISTKYSIFPVIDRRKQFDKYNTYDDFDQKNNFNPSDTRGPFSGYVNNIETESSLRNQYFALQHDLANGQYIPSSESELYKVTIVSKPTEQPYPNLFTQNKFDNSIYETNLNKNIGNDRFFNHTRTQLRSMDYNDE
jgi:hypothetical protein